MPNIYGAPEISVQDLSTKLTAGDAAILLDVRELHELQRASMGNSAVVVPLSQLAAQQIAALPAHAQDKDTEIMVLCHHGVRSAQVTAWLLQQGWANVHSVAGGIDAYAKEIDAAVGMY